jgi:hypothetical protein
MFAQHVRWAVLSVALLFLGSPGTTSLSPDAWLEIPFASRHQAQQTRILCPSHTQTQPILAQVSYCEGKGSVVLRRDSVAIRRGL